MECKGEMYFLLWSKEKALSTNQNGLVKHINSLLSSLMLYCVYELNMNT